jgi:hypothetical protein
VRRILLLCGLAALCGAAVVFGDARNDAVRLLLSMERRRLTAETKRMTELARRVDLAAGDVAVASSRAAAEGGSDAAAEESLDALARAASALESAVLDERLCADRIAWVRRRISDLEKEDTPTRSKKEDLLSGDWRIRIEPGVQEGDLHLQLDGTIVSGDYALDGGFAGSVRGTLVADRLRIERIDDRLGLSAVYYGRLSRDGSSLAGTWEATDLSAGAQTSGRWSAQKRTGETEK